MHDHLPVFSQIDIPNIQESFTQHINDYRVALDRAISTPEILLQTQEDLDENLNAFFAPISALNAGKATAELSKQYESCLLKLSELHSAVLHNAKLYNAYTQIDKTKLSPELKSALEYRLRDFKLEGVNLSPKKKEALKEIHQSLSQKQHLFEENIRLSSESFELMIEDKSKLSGLPETSLSLLEHLANEKNKTGYRITLDFPVYLTVMQNVDNRELRKALYRAFSTRASELAEPPLHDNTALMLEILTLRQKQAKLLGFDNFAEYSLKTKMAASSNEVIQFLDTLVKKAKPYAEKEWQALNDFAHTLGYTTVEAHDLLYLSEKLKKASFDISSDELKPYFPADKVIEGVFKTVSRLFNIDFNLVPHADCIDPSVKLFNLSRANENSFAYLYVDLFTRQGKRGGAWMAECHNRHRFASGLEQKPVAFLNCNFNPASKNQAALLSHDDIITLFHELGHCLHHLLTQVNVASISGINNVAWDAVELPSQFLENWAWDYNVLSSLSEHIDNKASLPRELFDKLLTSKHFQAGMALIRQLEFASFDFTLHLHNTIDNANTIQNILNETRKTIAVYIPPTFNRFQHSFSHIFAGGYAAGYYSYLWAEALSADCFSLFENEGLFDKTLSARFQKSILANGSAKPMQKLLEAFLHRPLDPTALLAAYGLS